MSPVTINYLAVLVCGIAAMVVGAVWYGPVFGKAWMAEVGKTEEELKEGFNPAKTYGLAFVGHLLGALVTAYLISLTGAGNLMEGIRIALAAWFGYTGGVIFVNGMFHGDSFRLMLINSFYHLTVFIVYAVILTTWK